jgi:glycosyltransferase involved in cell wall biosynthesis
MAGIGIRYLDFCRRLSDLGFQVVLVHPGEQDCGLDLGLNVEVRPYLAGSLARWLSDCQAVIVQGGLADPLLGDPEFTKPTVVDLYDPWMIENFVYLEPLGLEPYQRDMSSWSLQLSRGDFFLCSCEPQRLFYLGFLTALGRVEPRWAARDSDFRNLIDCVPFSLPQNLEPFRPLLPNKESEMKHLLFGCVYDWYDPMTLLAALEELPEPEWQLHLVRNPNPDTTPQRLLERVKKRCKELGWWGSKVLLHDWFPVERRFDLVREMDLLVSPHHPDLETRLSLRTRYLDALLAECPVIATRGGALSQALAEHNAGWLVEPGDSQSLSRAIKSVLTDPELVRTRVEAGKRLASNFDGETVLQPLLRFLEEPRVTSGDLPIPKNLTERLGGWLRRKAGL